MRIYSFCVAVFGSSLPGVTFWLPTVACVTTRETYLEWYQEPSPLQTILFVDNLILRGRGRARIVRVGIATTYKAAIHLSLDRVGIATTYKESYRKVKVGVVP